jgi:protein-S-isoprenylcysteine O-methyltransferase Ste14
LTMKFTFFFMSFMLIMSIQRIWETFFRINLTERGLIFKKWTLPALSITHFTVGIVTVIEYFTINRKINFLISLIGLGLYLFAFVLRNRSIRALGKYHSIHIEIREYHELIQKGPYKYIRHPYYCSVILEMLGFPLIPNSYYAFFIALFIYIPIVFIRLSYEEKAMIAKLGDEYIAYMKKTWGFIPS